MLDFFDLAASFVETLSGYGQLLFFTPLGVASPILSAYEDQLDGASPFVDLLLAINDFTLAEILFGSFLLTLLFIKLIGFLRKCLFI